MWFSFSFHFSPLRPAYVAKINGSLSLAECQRYAGLNVVVPDSLSFDNMMEGKTLPVYMTFTLSAPMDHTDDDALCSPCLSKTS